MKRSSWVTFSSIILLVGAGGAMANKPPWAGDGANKSGKAPQVESAPSGAHAGTTATFRFTTEDRRIVTEYYGTQARKGQCPPGLAKKNNGCLPPGQAKKWRMGQPLPKDLRYHELPAELRIQLPAPPPNYRYVQIAGDILMIAVGTMMVVDAIQDITR